MGTRGLWSLTVACTDALPPLSPVVISNVLFRELHVRSLYSDCICCNRSRVSVCMSACLCVSSLQPKRMGRFLSNFPQFIRQIFARSVFSDCKHLNLMT